LQDVLDVVRMIQQMHNERADVKANDIAVFSRALEHKAENVAPKRPQIAQEPVAARARSNT
jgi:hypothetical protein